MAAAKRPAAPVGPEGEAPAKRRRSGVPHIVWDAEMMETYISELEKPENATLIGTAGGNRKAWHGGKEKKMSAWKRIGETLFPEEFVADPESIVNRLRSKFDNIKREYFTHADRLEQAEGSTSDGAEPQPIDESNPLWPQVIADCPYFPRLHRLFGARPELRPPLANSGGTPAATPAPQHAPPPSQTQPSAFYQSSSEVAGSPQYPDGGDGPPPASVPSAPSPGGEYSHPITSTTGPGTAESPLMTSTSTNSVVTPRDPPANQEPACISPVTMQITHSNVPPLPELKPHLKTRWRRAASAKAKVPPINVSTIPPPEVRKPPKQAKRASDEGLLALQDARMRLEYEQHREATKLQHIKILFDEYKEGIWSIDEYKERRRALDAPPPAIVVNYQLDVASAAEDSE